MKDPIDWLLYSKPVEKKVVDKKIKLKPKSKIKPVKKKNAKKNKK